jgi:hypothetical protein
MRKQEKKVRIYSRKTWFRSSFDPDIQLSESTGSQIICEWQTVITQFDEDSDL